ncbi:MAG: phage tail protein [Verrucomicrobiota bacterium]
MSDLRTPLYSRLPAIYQIKDEEQIPPGQLKAYLETVEDALGAIHENIESLYHDFFIETCDEWVIPYLADLVGTTHLSGDPVTLRADVADTIALRRRKGTKGAVELLTYNLTKWGVHCVELRENLLWNQHLNHQRPDSGGEPPYGREDHSMKDAVRGGTVTLRSPSQLSLLATAFDPHAHLADVKVVDKGRIAYNLPNLAIFLWRLKDYRVRLSRPVWRGSKTISSPSSNAAKYVVRFDVHPLGRSLQLFNTMRVNLEEGILRVSQLDETPGPMSPARLQSGGAVDVSSNYVTTNLYDPTNIQMRDFELSPAGLQLHLPGTAFDDSIEWRFRGENLCAWETGLFRPLDLFEVAIDPSRGRLAIGVESVKQREALKKHLLLTYTYGAVGPVGAHPMTRISAPTEWNSETFDHVVVNTLDAHTPSLEEALGGLEQRISPLIITIQDSMVHELDLSNVDGILDEDGGPNLLLNRSLIIRSADGHRPIISLKQSLRVRPAKVQNNNAEVQNALDGVMNHLFMRLQGVMMTRDESVFSADDPLIARAALNSFEVLDATLDPGGEEKLDETRSGLKPSFRLKIGYGFSQNKEREAFSQVPQVIIQRSVVGSVFADRGSYSLDLADLIVDAGVGVGDENNQALAISSASEPDISWGPTMQFAGVTFFGKVRVESIHGQGGLFVSKLEVFNNQVGCIKFSYFKGVGDRLPHNYACIKGTSHKLRFTSEIFENAAYGQLACTSSESILQEGPREDRMGAFGFQLESHKWKNLMIRYREFMPVGVRPVVVPVT